MWLKRILKRLDPTPGPPVLAPGRFDAEKKTWTPLAADPTAAVEASSLTLLTFNVWFVDHHFERRAEALFDILETRAADVVALQEMTPELLDLLLARPFIRENYIVSDIVGASVDPYGVLLLSRQPVADWSFFPLPSRMFRHLPVMSLNLNGSVARVAGVHLESTPYEFVARERQLGVIFPLLEAAPHSFLMGDFNFCAIHGQENRALDPRYGDAWATLRPDEPGYTEDTDRNVMRLLQTEKRKRARFDRILFHSNENDWTPEAVTLLGDAPIAPELPEVFPSDHFGVEARFAWRG